MTTTQTELTEPVIAAARVAIKRQLRRGVETDQLRKNLEEALETLNTALRGATLTPFPHA